MFRGPLTVLLLRLGSVAALYTIVRILFWRYNLAMFPVPPGIVFAGGVRFDASAIAGSIFRGCYGCLYSHAHMVGGREFNSVSSW